MADNGPTMEGKLDLILQRLDGLTQVIDTMKVDMAAVKQDVENMQKSVADIKAKFDTKLAELQSNINKKIEDDVSSAKADIRNSMENDIKSAVGDKFAELDLDKLVKRQQELENELKELHALNDRPFHPDGSVVVYGYVPKEDETLDEQVNHPLYQVLELTVAPKFYERTSRKADQPGVLKIELKTVYDKVELLRPSVMSRNMMIPKE